MNESKKKINRALLSKAAEETERLRRRVPGYDSTVEIRNWRERRR